jgi:hypothetical protein
MNIQIEIIDTTCNLTHESIFDSIWRSVNNSTKPRIRSSVRHSVRDTVWDDVIGGVRHETRNIILEHEYEITTI